MLRAELSPLLQKLGVTSLLDAPCGDAGWISQVDLGARYVGIDIVPDLIERLRSRAASGEIRGEYYLADITADALPRCDAILCRDCLVHLSFANIARAVANFQRSGAVWLIATTFPERRTNADCEDGDWRALNFEYAPFNLGPPVELLNENCLEAGGGWRDKSLGVWRLAEMAYPRLEGEGRRELNERRGGVTVSRLEKYPSGEITPPRFTYRFALCEPTLPLQGPSRGG